MQKEGKIPGALHVQFVMGVKNAMPVDRDVFQFYVRTLRRLAPDATWTGAGIGKDQLTLVRWSLELGGGTAGQAWRITSASTAAHLLPPMRPW